MLVLRVVVLLAAATRAALLTALPPSVVDGLSKRGITAPTPVQAAALDRALSGESLVLHAETGSGKSLAFMLPALCRMREDPASQLLVLSPTRELCSQLGDELCALIRDGALGDDTKASVRMVIPGTKSRADDLLAARVIVATPAELCLLLAPKEGQTEAGPEDGADGAQGHGLAETLARQCTTLVLDEVDALVPGKKEFRGKRHWKWMDRGMHPAEAVVRYLAKRSSRDDFQVLAASATLDQSTRRKLDTLLKPSTKIGKLAVISAATVVEREDGAKTPDRWTVVPACIDHRTRALGEAGAAAAAAAVRELHEAAGGGGGENDAGKGALVFVSSRSTHLGGAHAVAKELNKLGLEASSLSDALFPASTRAIKRLPKSKQVTLTLTLTTTHLSPFTPTPTPTLTLTLTPSRRSAARPPSRPRRPAAARAAAAAATARGGRR